MKPYITSFLALILFSSLIAQKTTNPVTEGKIDSLLSIMTLEEKIGQLNQLSFGIGWGPAVKTQVPEEYRQLIRDGKIGSFLNAVGAGFTRELQTIALTESRVKIPLLFGYDVIHGFKTTFPVPLAEASSWDPELVRLSAHYQAKEAASVGIHWTFTPMVDIARDPRWGRIVEGSGEDTYLGSVLAYARVKGLQGDFSENNIIACAKHFAAYGGAEGGRDYNTVDISERTLREIYLPPFKAAIDAGALTFMCSFNEISGIPATGNKFLLSKILREEWKFDGFVVSDWNSIGELINHGSAANLKEAARISLDAGVDMDMESGAYSNNLYELIKENRTDIGIIDEAVRRILRIKYKLNLFYDPYKYHSIEKESMTVMSSEIQNAALETARRSIVLLKNENQLLPLMKTINKIAVIGPLAESRIDPLGSWYQMGDSNDVITVTEGIREVSPGSKIIFSQGCSINGLSREGFSDAIKAAEESDAVILVLGEAGNMSGEARSRSSLDLPGVQDELAREIIKTGKPVVVVLMNGRPLALQWISEHANAIVESWFLGIKSGRAIADVLFGNYNPSGKLPVTFPRVTGQIPVYYNHKNTGRPGNELNSYSSKYLDLPLTPLYPFGFGLSYTKFEYSKPLISKSKVTFNEDIRISLTVRNSGNYDGEEVVQLYIRDESASVTRPVKELKGFKKIFLKKGESAEVEFTLTSNDLAFYNDKMEFKAEAGKFIVYTGTNSEDVQSAEFELINPGELTGFISTRGKSFISPDGKGILLKGTNLGNWLVPEGYMFKFKNAASPRWIHEVISQLLPPGKSAKFWETFRDNYITEEDIIFLKQAGFNSVRVPFNYRLFVSEEHPGWEGPGFIYLDRVMDWCRKNNLYVLLDMHCAPGGQSGDNIDDSFGYPFLFEDELSRRTIINLWQKIAERYADETILIGYDLLNEPIAHYFDQDKLNPLLEPLYKEITAAVRKVDKNHLIFLGGAQWNSNFKPFGKPWDDKLVYTFHKYWTAADKSVIQDYIDFSNEHNVPLYMGESGENTNEWITEFRKTLDDNNISWGFWPYKKMDAASCLVTFNRPDGYDEVIKFADSSRSSFADIRKNYPADISVIEKALNDFLEMCRFENCRINEGYLKALDTR
jgi:beta-glucosidase